MLNRADKFEAVDAGINVPTPDAEKRICHEIGLVRDRHDKDVSELGRLFFDLKALYSERAYSAARRLSSGHGVFQKKIKALGFNPNRVREWVCDHEVRIGLRPPSESTAAKRKARRERKARGTDNPSFNAANPVFQFAILLPYSALKAAYRAALHELHPDHGGNKEKTRELIAAWESMFPRHSDTAHDMAEVSTVN